MNQDINEKRDICQLQGVIRSSPRAGREEEKNLSAIVRFKRVLKRRLNMKMQKKIKDNISKVLDINDRLHGRPKPLKTNPGPQPRERLNAGDLVRVRSFKEIQATLDRWKALKGCGFLDEMASYCGTDQKVLKRVERFIDERDYRLKKAAGIVLLDGVICSGTKTTGRCDRACFFFWREEWLEKLNRVSGRED